MVARGSGRPVDQCDQRRMHRRGSLFCRIDAGHHPSRRTSGPRQSPDSLLGMGGIGRRRQRSPAAEQLRPGIDRGDLMLLHTNGYAPDDRLLRSCSSIASMLFVPFGSQASSLPAFTAGTCCGLDALENPAKRDADAAAGGAFSTCSGCSAPPLWSCLLRFSVSRSLRWQVSRCWGCPREKLRPGSRRPGSCGSRGFGGRRLLNAGLSDRRQSRVPRQAACAYRNVAGR